MTLKQHFALIYDTAVRQHLRAIEPKYHSLIRAAVEDQLQFEPDVETRNRKPLQRPSILGTAWELRFGPNNRFRVFCRVYHESREVHILAIGVKRRNRLLIGKEEFEL